MMVSNQHVLPGVILSSKLGKASQRVTCVKQVIEASQIL